MLNFFKSSAFTFIFPASSVCINLLKTALHYLLSCDGFLLTFILKIAEKDQLKFLDSFLTSLKVKYRNPFSCLVGLIIWLYYL